MSDEKEQTHSDEEDEQKDKDRSHNRKKRKGSPEKSKRKDAKKSKRSKKTEEEDEEDKTPENSSWSELDKKHTEKKTSTAAMQEDDETKTSENDEKALVVAPQSALVSVSKNEPYLSPNDWLRTHPNFFEHTRVPEDIHFEKWTIPQGFRNAGKVTVRISNKKELGKDLLVVSPWMVVYKAHFTMDGNAKDPKALEFITDKLRPHLQASYFIGYMSKAWDANNDNGFGNDKDSSAYFLWHAKLAYHFFKFVAANDDVLTGLKSLDEKPSAELIYKRLIKHFRGPILQIPDKDPAADVKAVRPPLQAVDPAVITSCDKGVWIVKHKAPVYKKHESAPGRDKPPAGPMVLQNEKMREAYDLNHIFNHVPLYQGRSKEWVPYNKAKLMSRDIVSDMVAIKPFLQGMDSKTNLALFGISQKLQFARILKRGAMVDVDEMANRFADGDLAGEEYVDFNSEEPGDGAGAGTGAGTALDGKRVSDLLALPAPATGGATGSKGYQRV